MTEQNQEQDKYAVAPTRDTAELQKNYKTDAQRMRAKAAKARIAARQRAERDEAQKAAIAKIPPEHRSYMEA